MVRRGQQEKRKLQRAERSVLAELDSPHGRYRPPNRAECQFKQWVLEEDDSETIRVQFMLWRHHGQLVDFVVNVQTLAPGTGGWVSVERFDCCHGHCHHHPINDELDTRTIRILDDTGDVQEGTRPGPTSGRSQSTYYPQ